MDKKILKAAADTMRELGLSEVRIKDTETEIVLKREITAPVPAVSTVQPQPAAQMSAPFTKPPHLMRRPLYVREIGSKKAMSSVSLKL